MSIPPPPGVFDIIPEDPKQPWRSSYLWQHVEAIMREVAHQFGYLEMRTPLFERTELFQRSVGEGSDIVSKEMYTFEDRGKRSLSLRPEGTAPIMRSFVSNHMGNLSSVHKLFYIGPMFRYERSQAGRYRQHHQFGAEAIGTPSPEQDVEIIDLLYTVYRRLGLSNLEVQINSISTSESRHTYKQALLDYLTPYLKELSEDSQERFRKNPLRILDSKDPKDNEITANAPSLLEFLDKPSKAHFDKVQELLTLSSIPFTINDKLVRGLDYYNHTVFEVVAQELGAHNTIGAGGRYDGLLSSLGGPDLPAVGFGAGIERIIQTMLSQSIPLPEKPGTLLYLIPLGDEAKTICFQLTHQLRENNIPTQMDFSGRKLGKAMHFADQINSKYVAVIGEEELKTETVSLKEMSSGTSREAPLYHLARILKLESKASDYLTFLNEVNQPFDAPGQAEFFLEKLTQSIKKTKDATNKLQSAVKTIEDLL